MKILLVDDDESHLRRISRHLTEGAPDSIPVEIIMAQNVSDALDKLKLHQDIDLVITDTQMPTNPEHDLPDPDGRSGVDLIKTIRSNADYAEMPIVLHSSYVSINLKAEALTAGADSVHTKSEITFGSAGQFVKDFAALIEQCKESALQEQKTQTERKSINNNQDTSLQR